MAALVGRVMGKGVVIVKVAALFVVKGVDVGDQSVRHSLQNVRVWQASRAFGGRHVVD